MGNKGRSREREPSQRVGAQKSDNKKGHPIGYPFHKKSARRDSNPRPQPWQGCAPPTEQLAHICCHLATTIVIIYKAISYVNKNLEFFFGIFIYSIKHRNTGDLEVSSKTKIVVLHLKELIYTAIFAGLGVLLVILLCWN